MSNKSPANDSFCTTSRVLEFSCLYTHDFHRKAKRWQDGCLRFHEFNKRAMIYDLPRNFIGDIHAIQQPQEGDELTLEQAGLLVQVGEQCSQATVDVSSLTSRRVTKALNCPSGLLKSCPRLPNSPPGEMMVTGSERNLGDYCRETEGVEAQACLRDYRPKKRFQTCATRFASGDKVSIYQVQLQQIPRERYRHNPEYPNSRLPGGPHIRHHLTQDKNPPIKRMRSPEHYTVSEKVRTRQRDRQLIDENPPPQRRENRQQRQISKSYNVAEPANSSRELLQIPPNCSRNAASVSRGINHTGQASIDQSRPLRLADRPAQAILADHRELAVLPRHDTDVNVLWGSKPASPCWDKSAGRSTVEQSVIDYVPDSSLDHYTARPFHCYNRTRSNKATSADTVTSLGHGQHRCGSKREESTHVRNALGAWSVEAWDLLGCTASPSSQV